MSKLRLVKPQRVTRTRVDTIAVTPAEAKRWKSPPFQRPLRVNEKVRALAEEVKANGGVLPGMITLGVLDGDVYLIDGQHRREAFLLSGCETGYTDVRYHDFITMGEMGEEFVRLNSAISRFQPDDILRGLEGVSQPLTLIRQKCPFVGYGSIRRNANASALLSMSVAMRSWWASSKEVPTASGISATQMVHDLSIDEAKLCSDFLSICEQAFGRDPEFYRLWGALNLTMCAWLYRRTVLSQYTPKTTKLTKDLFTKCMRSLSADSGYIDWLHARSLNDVNRSPCYNRIKTAFTRRIQDEAKQRPFLPSPAWASH